MSVAFQQVIPCFRIFDEAKAREFYLEFLGFELAFEHRFAEDFPIYLGVRRGDCVLHLSEHHGDGSPGCSVTVMVTGLREYQQALLAKGYRYSRPGEPEETEWGTRELTISDPFGNRLTFAETVTG